MPTQTDAFDLDDGASEVVERFPRRRSAPPAELEQIAKTPAGGGMERLHVGGQSHRRDFIILRKAGTPPVKIPLAHTMIFKLLWRIWEAKRVSGAEDCGATVAELSDALKARGDVMATSSVSSALRSLLRNEVVRSVDQFVGVNGRRTRYYPTNAGIQAIALADTLGEGSFVQVGRTTKSWRGRNETEPNNMFQHASLLRGWSEP